MAQDLGTGEVCLMKPIIEVIKGIINDPFLTWDEKGRAIAEVLYFHDPEHVIRSLRRGEE